MAVTLTGWVGENHVASVPMALYGVVLLMAAIAYTILQYTIIYREGPNSLLAKALGKDFKGKISKALYAAAVALAFWQPWIAACIYLSVALMWLIPDRRIECLLDKDE